MKVKIGIVTYPDAVNVGAFLQQYAVYKTLESWNYQVEVVTYKSSFAKHEYMSRIKGKKKNFTQFLKLFEIYRFHRQTRGHFIYSPRCDDPRNYDWKRYSCVLFGSDEIWNLNNWFSGYCPILFGVGVSVPKISYAPSFGEVSDASAIPHEVKESLLEFSAVSCRDHNSKMLLDEILTVEATLVLDPTLIYPFSDELAARPPKRKGCFIVYATQVDAVTRDAILAYAKERSLTLLALGTRHDWADCSMVEDHPLQVLSEFQHAECVFTNTFHGCALALKFAKPVVLGDIHGKVNKITSLLRTLQANCPFFDPTVSYASLMEQASKPNLNALNSEIEKSTTFLKESIGSALTATH